MQTEISRTLTTLINLLQAFGWIALTAFSLHHLWLLGMWVRQRHQAPRPAGTFATLPMVTVQLPTFNERYVISRLLDAVSKLDYPRDRLEIQVLDDSTDETTALAAQHVAALKAQGFQISLLHRQRRGGFKAGALADGLAIAQGEFVALFDADFVPPPDFLRRTVHYFTDPSVGMVQTRWGHLNRFDSFLTRAQALMLDGHFLVEQVARSRSGYFFNFNGSAGIWRKQTIVDSGGWQPDTLTEDLDLSYRAQLRGWKFRYLPDVVCPAELPSHMSSLKAQQFRWTKGSIQTAMKLLPSVWRSDRPLRVKFECCFHLGNWFHYPLGVLVTLLVLPSLIMSCSPLGTPRSIEECRGLAGLLLFSTTLLFHLVVQWQVGLPWWSLLTEVPALMAISVGIAISNSRAIWEAICGTPSSFHRTPKYNGRWRLATSGYRAHPSGAKWWWTEVGLGIYVSVAVWYAAARSLYGAVPFLLPLSIGLLYTGLSSFESPGSFKGKASQPVMSLGSSELGQLEKVA